MAVKKRGLGKGLDMLIPNKADTQKVRQMSTEAAASRQPEGERIATLPLQKVEPNRSQPRKKFDTKGLNELADSIREHGVITPILVQKEDDYYQIVAGERRWRAAKIAGLKEIPAIIKNYEGAEKLAVSLIENIQREDLDVIEEAQAYRQLIDDYALTQEQVAKRVSKSRTAITNAMRLLNLDERVQTMLAEGAIAMGHARALLAIKSKTAQYALAQKVAAQQMSVREVERAVKQLSGTQGKASKTRKKKESDPYLRDMEEKMAQAVGTKVIISEKARGKGKIEIEYYSMAELDRLFEISSRKGYHRHTHTL